MARNTRSRSNSFRSKSFDETSSTTTTTTIKRKDSVSKQNDYSDGPSTSSAYADAKELLQILQQLHRNGRNLLHHATTQPNLLPLANLLLQRLHQVVSHDKGENRNDNNNNNNNNNNNKTLLTEFLSQPDWENGYTPLHWSIRNANLGVLLLLLRHSHQPSRFLTRPMQLLQSEHNHHNHNRDHEGWTPSQLLSQLQIKTLQACRKHIQRPQVVAPSSRQARSRSNSFLQDDEQPQPLEDEPLGDDNELGLLQSRANLLQPVQDSTTTTTSSSSSVARQPFGCEVLTFGSANHCALGVGGGVGGGTATSVTKHRPQRLAAFGLADSSGAVQVAAAPHHTMVLTAEGRVYTLGLGKGGRLGVGHEQSLPQPTLLGGALSKRRVVHVAAAENHSLCCTSDGHVYAWGSNRFGQVSCQHSVVVIQTTPRRVDELRGQHCLSVAAGDKHSVALTRTGHVYSWGDNSQGQLGRRRRSSTNNRFGVVDRIVDALSTKTVSAIAASEHSTLALTLPAAGAIHHAVYAWGHGNPVPTKVTFLQDNTTTTTHDVVVDPVRICSAKHHNAVVTSDGSVYTWGLHAETLGSTTTKSETTSSKSSAWLVAKPVDLPEKAVQVSAHDHHTAVVTQEGHLYTWGATIPTNVMGHEGVRYQPSPKRVEGVHRAVQVAVAKEHTVFLMGTAFPALEDHPPDDVVVSLEHLAALQATKHVDLFNVLPVSILAERNQSWWLQRYCQRFIQLNLDGVLLLGRKADLNQYLENCLSAPTPRLDPDDTLVHPLVTQALLPHRDDDDKAEWLAACKGVLENLPISTRVRYPRRSLRQQRQRRRALSFHEQDAAAAKDDEEDGPLQAGVQGCSKRCLMLTSGLDRLESSTDIVARHDCLSKELRGIRKRLGQIAKLEQKTGVLLTPDERGKVARKPLLEADQVPLENALTKLKRVMEQRNLVQEEEDHNNNANKKKKKKETEMTTADSPKKVQFAENPAAAEPRLVGEFYCAVCSVQCPDAHSLALHQNGRKHRNRILQCAQDEEKRTAASLERNNKPNNNNKTPQQPIQPRPLNPWKTDPVQPKYKLAPPPHKPGPCASPATPTKRSWCPETTKPTNKVDDFRSILAEQERKQSKTVLTPRVPPKAKPPQGLLLQPGSMAPPPLKSPPWATSPMARVPVHNVKVVASDEKGPSNTKPSLGEFLLVGPPKPSPKTTSSTAAPWASPTAKISKDPSSSPAVAVATAAASLKEIQKQEEALRSRCSDNIAKDRKWYIRHAERAGSFSAIVEEAAREREMQRFVEEQRQIEAEIQKSQKEAQTNKKTPKNRQQPKKKKKKKNTNNDARKRNTRKPQSEKNQNTEKSSQGKQKTSGPRRGGAKATTACNE